MSARQKQRECVVCQDLFGDALLMTCLHSICNDCLKDVKAIASEKRSPLVCPLCHEHFSSEPSQGFSTDVDNALVTCLVHPTQQITCFCIKCDKTLCALCVNAKQCSGHKLEDDLSLAVQLCLQDGLPTQLAWFQETLRALEHTKVKTSEVERLLQQRLVALQKHITVEFDRLTLVFDEHLKSLQQQQQQLLSGHITQAVIVQVKDPETIGNRRSLGSVRRVLQLGRRSLRGIFAKAEEQPPAENRSENVATLLEDLNFDIGKFLSSAEQLEKRRDVLISTVSDDLHTDFKILGIQREQLDTVIGHLVAVQQLADDLSKLAKTLSCNLVGQAHNQAVITKDLQSIKPAHVLQLYERMIGRRRALHNNMPALEPAVRDSLRFFLPPFEPVLIPAAKFGHVGRLRDYRSIHFIKRYISKSFSQAFAIAPSVTGSLIVGEKDSLCMLTPNGTHRVQLLYPPFSLTSDSLGNVWVSSEYQSTYLYPMGWIGTPIREIPVRSYQVATRPNGDVFCSEFRGSAVHAFSKDASRLWTCDQLTDVRGIAIITSKVNDVIDKHVDSPDLLFVSQGGDQDCIQVLSAFDGQKLRTIGSGQLQDPTFLAITEDAHLVVIENAVNRVSILNPFSGEIVHHWRVQNPKHFCILPGDGEICITMDDLNLIAVY